eukprot:1107165-Pleurochrysis_carterae.AAC.2
MACLQVAVATCRHPSEARSVEDIAEQRAAFTSASTLDTDEHASLPEGVHLRAKEKAVQTPRFQVNHGMRFVSS